jgi:putative hydrolase of the HAD superfamily
MLRGLTFDLWQTLIYDTRDSARSVLRAEGVGAALAGLGYRFPVAEILAALQACEHEHDIGDPEKEFAPFDQVGWILGRLGIAGQDLPRAQAAAFTSYAEAALVLPPEVFPQAVATVGSLAQHYPLALICNTGATPGPVLRALLQRFGMGDHFQALVFSDELGCRKPSPLAFQAAIDGLHLEPHEVVHIGDNPYSDVHGAKRLGMGAILLSGGWHSSRPYLHPGEETALAPDAVVGSLLELPAAVAALAGRMRRWAAGARGGPGPG